MRRHRSRRDLISLGENAIRAPSCSYAHRYTNAQGMTKLERQEFNRGKYSKGRFQYSRKKRVKRLVDGFTRLFYFSKCLNRGLNHLCEPYHDL